MARQWPMRRPGSASSLVHNTISISVSPAVFQEQQQKQQHADSMWSTHGQVERNVAASAASAAAGEQQRTQARVDVLLHGLKSQPLEDLFASMESKVAALMDVGVKFHTSFGKVQDSVPAMERALAGLCNRIVASVDDHVVFDPDINAADDTTAVALTKTKADYHRYLFELTSNAQSRLGLASLSQRQHQMKKRRRSSAALAAEPHLDRAFQAYRHAAEHAFDTLEPTTALYLQSALNFATFCDTHLDQPRLAYETAEQAYNNATEALDDVTPEELDAIAPVLQRLRDCMSRWSTRLDVPGDLDSLARSSDSDDADSTDGAKAAPADPATPTAAALASAPPLPAASLSSGGTDAEPQPGGGSPVITIPTARSGSSILDGDDLDAALDSGAVPWLRAKPGGGGGKGRSFSPVQSVLSGGDTSPRSWLSSLRSKRWRRKRRRRGRRSAGGSGAGRASGSGAGAGAGDARLGDGGGAGSDGDSDDDESDSDGDERGRGGGGGKLKVLKGSVGVDQIQVALAHIPRIPPLEVTKFDDAVTLVPPLHEIFSQYTPQVAAAGKRNDGGSVVFDSQLMEVDTFISQATGSRRGPCMPESHFHHFLRDFRITPKLLSQDEAIVVMRMTTRNFPRILIRKRDTRAGFVGRRRASVAASNFSYDPHLLVPDDKQPVSLSYLDFLDALGRVALLAFAQPPYRNRYDSARARIHGFLTDFLRLDKPDWRAQLSKKPTLLMDAKHLGYKQEVEAAPNSATFVLSQHANKVLTSKGVSRAMHLLFNYYKRVHLPHGKAVLFSDIEGEMNSLDVNEYERMLVDFGLDHTFLSHRDVESLFRAQQLAEQHLGRGEQAQLDKAERRRAVVSAQSEPLTYAAFVRLVGRTAVELQRTKKLKPPPRSSQRPASAGSGQQAAGAGQSSTQEPSHEAAVTALLITFGLPPRPSKSDATSWWAQARVALAAGARATDREHGNPEITGRPINWRPIVGANTPTGKRRSLRHRATTAAATQAAAVASGQHDSSGDAVAAEGPGPAGSRARRRPSLRRHGGGGVGVAIARSQSGSTLTRIAEEGSPPSASGGGVARRIWRPSGDAVEDHEGGARRRLPAPAPAPAPAGAMAGAETASSDTSSYGQVHSDVAHTGGSTSDSSIGRRGGGNGYTPRTLDSLQVDAIVVSSDDDEGTYDDESSSVQWEERHARRRLSEASSRV